VAAGLTEIQLEALRSIAEKEGGAWGRAVFDGTAEAFTAHRGGLRRFTIDREGVARFDREIPPTERFETARVVAVAAAISAVAGVGNLLMLWRADTPIERWWLWPAVSAAVAFLIAAAFFGVHARLPSRDARTGPWVGFPGAGEGDLSGHTMPGLVREHPIFAAGWLVVLVGFGTVAAADKLDHAVLGTAAGIAAWWAMMLCFSRGWVKEGD
jgi:hypothetical protein